MIPRGRLIFLIVVLGIASTGTLFFPGITRYWLTAAGVAALVVAIDALLGWRVPVPAVVRSVPRSMSQMNWVDVGLQVRNDSAGRALTLSVFDHHPDGFDVRDLPLTVSVGPRRYVDLAYHARPQRRGEAHFPACDLRIVSPLGLWSRRHRLALPSDVRVYPNYSTISKLLAYEVDNRLSLTGIRLSRRRGEGIEFHQLRDYRDGDSLRAIDWKATSRTSRLIAREYQDERDQQVVFMLDAGRRMLAKDAELSHFDHTLNAMLLMCFVALRQGDATGAMTVGAERTWLPPRKGAATLNGLLNHVYRVEPQPVEIDYLSAATELAVKQRRRSLIVMLTNVREEDTSDLLAATNLLRRRHVVIVASLRERALDDAVDLPVAVFDDAVLQAATCQYLEARRESHRLLRANGVFVEDCLSTELPRAITNRYLAIKRAGLL